MSIKLWPKNGSISSQLPVKNFTKRRIEGLFVLKEPGDNYSIFVDDKDEFFVWTCNKKECIKILTGDHEEQTAIVKRIKTAKQHMYSRQKEEELKE